MAYSAPPNFVAGSVVTETQLDTLSDDISWLYAHGVQQGTAFPGSPVTNDLFFRTDHGTLYFYNGSGWIATQPGGALTQAANLVYAGPASGAAAAPAFRALASDDIPNLSAAKITSGILAAARGGTGVASMPTFAVRKSAAQAVATSTFTKVTWETETFDSDNCFASGTFTPNVAGKYLLSAATIWQPIAANISLVLRIYKNGSVHRERREITDASDFLGPALSVIVEANGTTDNFEVYAWQNSGSSQNIHNDQATTFYTGAWIAP